MTDDSERELPNPAEPDDLAAQARQKRSGLAAEFLAFLRDNKKWWLAPILLTVAGLGLLVMLSGTAAAPFIYTLF